MESCATASAVVVVDDDRASSADEHAAPALDGDGPRPRCCPHLSPCSCSSPAADDLLPPCCVPTYDVMAAASAVWKPGSDVITLAIVSVSAPAGALPLAEEALCGW